MSKRSPGVYSTSSYGKMIADRVRTGAYDAALRSAVRPGAVVLDIGTGPGILAMLACKYGARRVYAIEPDDVIEVARKAAAANGLTDRIEFIQDYSTNVTLPEQADVIVSDLHGVLPLYHHLIPSIIDARRRLLAPGGTLIPRKETLWLSLADAPEVYRQHYEEAWDGAAYGLDLSAGREVVVNTWRKDRFSPEQLLLPPRCWATLDYTTVESANVSAEVSWTAEREGMAHGVVAWFDSVLGDDIAWSNAPGSPELIYGNAFFPLLRPVALAAGDAVSIRVCANLVGGEYVWRWETRVHERGDPTRVKADFKQTTFKGVPLSPERLRRQSSEYAPELDAEGEMDRFILSLMDGIRPLDEIARQLSEQYPDVFDTADGYLERVRELSLRYGR